MRRSLPFVAALFVRGSLSAPPARAEDSAFGAPESTGETRFDFVCTSEQPWPALPPRAMGRCPTLPSPSTTPPPRLLQKRRRRACRYSSATRPWAREWMSLFAGGLGAPDQEAEGWQKLREAMQGRLTHLKRMDPRGRRTFAGE
jgi:hypothetical protein